MIKVVKAKSFYEAEVWEYDDRIVAHCLCNNCGERFSITLRASKDAVNMLTTEQKKKRIFMVAHRKHNCDTDALQKDPAETNRIVNKWHEYKLKMKNLIGVK